jgi:acetylornithine aminotransferase
MGAVAACGAYGELFAPGEHGSTFGGSSLAVAAANATIDELHRIDAAGQAAQMGELLAAGLERLPHVTEVRGYGLMRGASLDVPVATEVVKEALKEGLVLNAIGDNILRFLPPLVVTHEHIAQMLAILTTILAKEVHT